MKAHTSQFKTAITQMGRQIDSIITYDNITLHDELYAVTPLFEGNVLKSIMKQLDIQSSVDIPIDTIVNFRFGVLVGSDYEYLDYGNYVVVKSEKQEDTNTYKITCYDKMVYSMKQNEDLGLTYPISLKNYLIAIANAIGLQVENTTFANQNKMIPTELYAGLEYTYRDILDEIAQATGSNIIINSNDKIEVKYINVTNDIIDENYLKDVNVKFKEKFGPVNTIVLSRSGEADNIYYPSPLPQNPIPLKIVDNQIMNRNDRDEYLPELYAKLNGLEFYINDFNSTGICYYDVCDLYNISIGENTYKCIMFNDEINITSGLEEIIHTEMPEQSETDYEKADKTDRRINQTTLIVDKQNQTIEAVVSNVSEQNQKIAIIQQDVDEIKSEIQDIADITESKESTTASVSIDDITESEPVRIVVHPIGTNISFLYPSLSLYPSGNLYMPVRKIRFANTTTGENFDYELPTDLLYYDANNYDEFILDYEGQSCVVNKRVGYNADGTTYVLPSEQTIEYDYPQIELTDGDYTISLIGYEGGYLFARMMVKNIYTDQFATKAELNSVIRQTKDEIDLSVNQKLTNYSTTSEMNSAIDIKANQITSSVSETYETKTNATINYNTLNNKFGSYYTKTETNSQIEQTAGQITTRVEAVETRVGTLESDSIIQVDVEYALSTSTTTAPSSGWSTTAPQWEQGKYMWERTKVTYADNTTETSNPTCIAGAKGDKGNTGDTGIGVSSIEEQYYLSTSDLTPTGGTWKSTQDTWQDGMYIWTRSKVTWTNNTITYTTPVLANGINNANETAKSASDTASTTQAYAENINSSLGGRLDTADAEIAGIRETLVTQNTTIEVNKNSLEASINTLTEETTRIGDQVTHNETEQKKYLRYYEDPNNDNKGTLELGENDSPFKTKITNDEMAFTENDSKVAYINSKKMYITTAEILNSLVLGNFGFTPLANGSVTFGKVK